jgi:ATP-dependent Lon protease
MILTTILLLLFSLDSMDVPVNLSHILFVCTANNLSTIPAPLLDRMEVLEVSGYVSEEKAEIARRFLGPQAKVSAGLGPVKSTGGDGKGEGNKKDGKEQKSDCQAKEETKDEGKVEGSTGAAALSEAQASVASKDGADVVLTDEAIDMLIKYYCRESGVRNLKKSIDKVCFSLLFSFSLVLFCQPAASFCLSFDILLTDFLCLE